MCELKLTNAAGSSFYTCSQISLDTLFPDEPRHFSHAHPPHRHARPRLLSLGRLGARRPGRRPRPAASAASWPRWAAPSCARPHSTVGAGACRPNAAGATAAAPCSPACSSVRPARRRGGIGCFKPTASASSPGTMTSITRTRRAGKPSAPNGTANRQQPRREAPLPR